MSALAFTVVSALGLSHANWSSAVTHCFNLHFPNDLQCWAYFYKLICYSASSVISLYLKDLFIGHRILDWQAFLFSQNFKDLSFRNPPFSSLHCFWREVFCCFSIWCSLQNIIFSLLHLRWSVYHSFRAIWFDAPWYLFLSFFVLLEVHVASWIHEFIAFLKLVNFWPYSNIFFSPILPSSLGTQIMHV